MYYYKEYCKTLKYNFASGVRINLKRSFGNIILKVGLHELSFMCEVERGQARVVPHNLC